nr:isatin hydrolase-like isoform X1 [Procambarus clarkii]
MPRLASSLALVCVAAIHGALADGSYVDLTYSFDESAMKWPSRQPFSREEHARGYTPRGYWYESYSFCMSEHAGTHMDAPSHFAEGKWSIDQIPITHFMGQGVVVDIQDKVENNPVAELTSDDLMTWMDEHGPLPDGVILFVRTGWGKRYGNKTAYFGTDTNDTSNLIFPGINPGAAQLLTGYEAATGRRVFGVGLDTPSLDNGPSTLFTSHVELFTANIYGLENVANLEKLPTTGFQVIVMPMKIRGGSGAPVRIIATLSDANSTSHASAPMSLLHFTATVFLLVCRYLQSL